MRKNIKLSESDLTRIVKRVINESVCITDGDAKNYKEIPDGTYKADVYVSNNRNCFSFEINNQTYTID